MEATVDSVMNGGLTVQQAFKGLTPVQKYFLMEQAAARLVHMAMPDHPDYGDKARWKLVVDLLWEARAHREKVWPGYGSETIDAVDYFHPVDGFQPWGFQLKRTALITVRISAHDGHSFRNMLATHFG